MNTATPTAAPNPIHNPTLAKGLIAARRAHHAATEALHACAQRYVLDYLESRNVRLGERVTGNRMQTFVLTGARANPFLNTHGEHVGIEYTGRLVRTDNTVSDRDTRLWLAYAPDGQALPCLLTLSTDA